MILIGHGLGGLVAAGYLESDRSQPDLAVLMSPELAGWDEQGFDSTTAIPPRPRQARRP